MLAFMVEFLRQRALDEQAVAELPVLGLFRDKRSTAAPPHEAVKQPERLDAQGAGPEASRVALPVGLPVSVGTPRPTPRPPPPASAPGRAGRWPGHALQ